MAVYQRTDSAIWWYEFRFRGKRFRGSTGETDRAAAEAEELRAKRAAGAVDPAKPTDRAAADAEEQRAKRAAEAVERARPGNSAVEESIGAPLSREQHPDLCQLLWCYDETKRLVCIGTPGAVGLHLAPGKRGTYVEKITDIAVKYFPTEEAAKQAWANAVLSEKPLHVKDWRPNVYENRPTPSVYKRKDSPYWCYRFTVRGEKFQGTTKQTDRAAAEAFARSERTKREAEVLQ